MQIDITLAGAQFRPAEAKEFIRLTLREGDMCKIARDAKNEYDERAVRILGVDETDESEIFIGFVPKSDNLLLSQALDADPDMSYECICTGFVGTLQPTFSITFEAPVDVESGD